MKRISAKATLALVLVLGGLLRLAWFDLMEFKYDEVAVIVLAREWLGRGIPRYGMMSGVGIRNPPGFLFVLCPLAALTPSPLCIGLAIALFNIAAVGLIYHVGAAAGSRQTGLWSAAFMAAHPWLTLYSRKIWAQSLLPFSVTLFLLVVVHCLRRPRSRAAVWIGPIVALTWQIHYSAYALLFFAVLWVAHEALRRRINGPMLTAGLLLGALTLIPYLRYVMGGEAAEGAHPLAVGSAQGAAANAWNVFRAWSRTAFAGGFGYPFAAGLEPLTRVWADGKGRLLELAATLATLGVLALALGTLASRWPAGGEGKANGAATVFLWLGLFAVVAPLAYAVRGIPSPPHYFIIGLPALLVLAGEGIARLLARGSRPGAGGALRAFGWAAGLAIVLAGSGIWLAVLAELRGRGGSVGDYGTAYRVQREAAAVLAAEHVGPADVDARFTRDHSIGIHYLLTHVYSPAPDGVDRKAQLIDMLTCPEAARKPLPRPGRSKDVGRLRIRIYEP